MFAFTDVMGRRNTRAERSRRAVHISMCCSFLFLLTQPRTDPSKLLLHIAQNQLHWVPVPGKGIYSLFFLDTVSPKLSRSPTSESTIEVLTALPTKMSNLIFRTRRVAMVCHHPLLPYADQEISREFHALLRCGAGLPACWSTGSDNVNPCHCLPGELSFLRKCRQDLRSVED